jgi:hypothetical protein
MLKGLKRTFASETVESPRQNYIEFPPASSLEKAAELYACVLAGLVIDVFAPDLPLLRFCKPPHLDELVFGLLAIRGDSSVYGGARPS